METTAKTGDIKKITKPSEITESPKTTEIPKRIQISESTKVTKTAKPTENISPYAVTTDRSEKIDFDLEILEKGEKKIHNRKLF